MTTTEQVDRLLVALMSERNPGEQAMLRLAILDLVERKRGKE